MMKRRSELRESHWAGWFQGAGLVLGGLLTMIGAALPWLHSSGLGETSVEGYQFEAGQWSFFLGIAAVALGLLAASTTNWRLHFFLAVAGLWLAAGVLAPTFEQLDQLRLWEGILGFIAYTVGNGIYVTLAGGSLIAFDSVLGLLPGLRRLVVLTR
jgi:hypothetical protein